MDDSESSTAAEDRTYLHPDEKNVQIFATQMLKSRIFMGHFQERRYVESLKSYRDVIVVNDAETDLKNAIDVVRKRLRGFYGNDQWIGLTAPGFVGAPEGYCLWTESRNDKLGRFWFRIRDVRFRKNEILVRLKIIRQINDLDFTDTSSPAKNVSDLIESFSMNNMKVKILNILYIVFANVFNSENIIQTCKFLVILLVTSFTVFIKGIECAMEFLLRFMREISVLIQAMTPVMIAIVNFFGKIVGGFYFLIAMIWRDSTQAKLYRDMDISNFKSVESQTYRAIEAPKYRAIEPPNYRAIESSNYRTTPSPIYRATVPSNCRDTPPSNSRCTCPTNYRTTAPSNSRDTWSANYRAAAPPDYRSVRKPSRYRRSGSLIITEME